MTSHGWSVVLTYMKEGKRSVEHAVVAAQMQTRMNCISEGFANIFIKRTISDCGDDVLPLIAKALI